MLGSIGFPAWILALAVFAGPSRAWAQGDGVARKRAAAKAELVSKLDQLARWCNEREVFAARDEVWKLVLAVSPDDQDARKGLRHTRARDGTWKEPPPRAATNRNPAALAEVPRRRAEILVPYRDRVLALLDEGQADAAARRAAWDEMLRLDPDDEVVRKLLGDVRSGTRWVLPETPAGDERRRRIRELARQCLSNAPAPLPDAATAEESALVAGWKVAVRTPAVRVLGTGEEGECGALARSCSAAAAFFAAVLGVQPVHPPGFTIYLVAAPGEKDGFLGKLPSLKPDERAAYSALIGGGIPGTYHLGLWGGDPKRRLDLALRNELGHLARDTFGVGPRHGWIWEGLGLYLTGEIAGTRLNWFIAPAPNGEEAAVAALRRQLQTADWMVEARKLLESGAAPKLEEVLKLDAGAMGPRELLEAYALVAYLLEARPEQAPEILRRAGRVSGEGSGKAVEAVLGLALPELQARLARWLRESFAGAPGPPPEGGAPKGKALRARVQGSVKRS